MIIGVKMCAIDDRPADTSGSYRFIAESFGKDVAEGTTYMLEVELPEVQHDPCTISQHTRHDHMGHRQSGRRDDKRGRVGPPAKVRHAVRREASTPRAAP